MKKKKYKKNNIENPKNRSIWRKIYDFSREKPLFAAIIAFFLSIILQFFFILVEDYQSTPIVQKEYNKELVLSVNTSFEGVNIEMIKDYNGNEIAFEIIEKLKVSNFDIHKLNKDKIISLFSAMGLATYVDDISKSIKAIAYIDKGKYDVIKMDFDINYTNDTLSDMLNLHIYNIYNLYEVDEILLYDNKIPITTTAYIEEYLTAWDVNSQRLILYFHNNKTCSIRKQIIEF